MAETDHDLRIRVLQKLYEQRHSGRLVQLPQGLADLGLNEQVLGSIMGQLRERRQVEWTQTMGGHCRGAARIAAEGVDLIETPQVLTRNLPDSSSIQAHPIHTLVGWGTLIPSLVLMAVGAYALYLPKPLTSGINAKGRFSKQDFVYVAADDVYLCPAGERLNYYPELPDLMRRSLWQTYFGELPSHWCEV